MDSQRNGTAFDEYVTEVYSRPRKITAKRLSWEHPHERGGIGRSDRMRPRRSPVWLEDEKCKLNEIFISSKA